MKITVFLLCFTCIMVIFVIVYLRKLVVSKYRPCWIAVNIPGQGIILGNIDKTAWTKQNFMQFRGIPYAESPSGPLRFKAPIPKLSWSHCVDATKFGHSCPSPQSVMKPIDRGDPEDCLNLCVYTKNLKASQPVIFYIYGGGFNNGTAVDYPPKYLLEKNIVLVVPHYRVGLLGWAFAKSKEIPGNMALLDIQLALQWVTDNIATFGGNPNAITTMGQSGGACLAGALMLSPKTKPNYMRRSIIMSGSVLSKWAINMKYQTQIVGICKKLNCINCDKNKDLLFCLNKASVSDIIEASKNEFFSPVIGDFYGVLPEQPSVLIKKFKRSVPLLTGFTKHDGSFALAIYYDELLKMNRNFSEMTVQQFACGLIQVIEGPMDISCHQLSTLFPSELLNSTNHKLAIPAYIDLASIEFMKLPVLNVVSHLVRKNISPIYLYTLDYKGQHTRFGYGFPTHHYPFNGGVHHSDDNLYLFSTHKLNKEDTKIAKRMVELWTSFAITGKPTHTKAPAIQPVKDETGPYFSIDIETIIKHNVLEEYTAASNDPKKNSLIRDKVVF